MSGTVQVVTSNTSAYVGKSAKVNVPNLGAGVDQSVLVAAGNVFHQLLVAASVAGGEVGVGASVTVGVVTLNTDAYIDDSATVNAANDVVVSANGQDTIVSVAFSGAGGIVGVAGAVSVIVLNTHTYADTGTGVTITAGNNVFLSASDATKLIIVAGGVAGGFVGVGVGVGVTSVTKDTEVFVGAGSTIDAKATRPGGLGGIYDGTITGAGFGTLAAFHGFAVQASSSENVFGLAVAVGGGFVGVAGAVDVTLLHVTTQAYVGNGAQINTDAGASAAQSVNVAAADSTKTLTIAGGVAGGFVGVAGGIDIGVADTSTAAYLAAGAVVHAMADVGVYALAIKQIQTYALSIGGGFVGAAGSVSVWTIGTEPDTTYNDGQGGPDKGAWSPSGVYNQSDTVTGSDGNKYGAKVDHPTQDPTSSGQTQWEGPTDSTQTSGGSAAGQADGQSGIYTRILDGTSSGSGNSTDTRIRSTTGANSSSGVKKQVSDSAPSSTLVADQLADHTLPQGTAAAIDATVVAGGNVVVLASENLGYDGIAGTAAGGVGAIGASILIANLEAHADASVGATGSISAGGFVGIGAATTENTNGLAFAGQVGLVALGAQVVVINDSSTQSGHVDDGASIPNAAGGIIVGAVADRSVTPQAIGGALAGVAAGAAVAIGNVSGDTTATIGNVAIGGGGTIGSLTVAAISTISVPVTVISVEAGVGGGLGAAVGIATIDGKTEADSGAHGTVVGNVSVAAKTTSTATVSSLNVATGAGAAVGVTVAVATVGRSTIADVSPSGNTPAGGSVKVTATSRSHATATAPGATIGGMAVAVMLPFATVSGSTEAHLDGSAPTSTSITVQAIGDNLASAEADILNLSIGGVSGAFADAEIGPSPLSFVKAVRIPGGVFEERPEEVEV